MATPGEGYMPRMGEDGKPAGEEIADRAEEVRAYVVALRGGAPFLSGADGRLLVRWLEDGVPVAAILAAVDRTAERRRKKRTRGRLTLSACRSQVAAAEAAPPATAGALAPLAAELATMDVPATLVDARTALVAALAEADGAPVDGPSGDAALAAVAGVRAFHEAAWANADQAAAIAMAEQELVHLRDALDGDAWAAALGEVARDLVRQRWPRVSARVVWDTLAGSA